MLIVNYQKDKVADIIRKEKPEKVCLIFWHGLGDLVMFIPLLNKLRALFPTTKIDMALQDGVGQEKLVRAVLIKNPNKSIDGYEYTFQVHFPMAEHLAGLWTKSEWCCKEELGIDPICYYLRLKKYDSKLVALHFQATALPDPVNPNKETAKKIWGEVKSAGFIPIEAFFKHRYYNPKNEKFSFIDSTVREVEPSVSKLISLLQCCCASICVASGNLPLSLAIMPDKTLYLKKEYPIAVYTREDISSVDVNNYREGSVAEWLGKL